MIAKIWNWNNWVDITDPEKLKADFGASLKRCGFNVLGLKEHHFEPQGYTCIFLLGESHFAIHTFPEEKKTYIELSSCNGNKHEQFVKEWEGKCIGRHTTC